MNKIFTKVKGMTPIQYEVRNPSGDWSSDFGDIITEPQKFGTFDTSSCWDASPCKGTIEMQMNYLVANNLISLAGMVFLKTPIPEQPNISFFDPSGSVRISERFPEILSKNMDNGGTAVEAEQLFQQYGCIPWSMLNYTDAQAAQWQTQEEFDADYFNQKAITIQMITLGRQFLQFVNIAFQRIGIEGTTPAIEIMIAACKQAPPQAGIAIDSNVSLYNQVNVPVPDNNVMAHEITITSINSNGSYQIVDNYNPFIKTLAADYPLLAVLQGIVTAIPDQTPPVPQNSFLNAFWQAVMGFWNGIFYPNKNVGDVASEIYSSF